VHGDPIYPESDLPSSVDDRGGLSGLDEDNPIPDPTSYVQLSAADSQSKLAAAEREIRALRADLALREWKPDDDRERTSRLRYDRERIAELEQAIREFQSSNAYLILSKIKRFRDRLFPVGTRRSRLARLGGRCITILSREGVPALLRSGVDKVKRRFLSTGTTPKHAKSSSQAPGPATIVSAGSIGGHSRSYRIDQPTISLNPPRLPQNPRGLRISVASSSLGNCFFHQIRDLIAAGLAELGHQVLIENERDGFKSGVSWRVIIAPHEYFYLGAGESLRHAAWPENVILVSTEQPSTPWFARAWECLPKANAVWDIDYNTAGHLRQRGIACDYLPLGFVPGHAAFSKVERIAAHYGSCFLSESVRGTRLAGGPLRQRPLDLFFIGGATPRREAFLSSAAPSLADYKTYIHLYDSKTPLLQGKNTYMDTASVVGLSQRSKVLLNLHRGDDVYFEWQRIVLQGIWQKTLVVSEVCSDAPPFRAGVDFVEARVDEIPRILRYYLSDPRGQREAQEIAQIGYDTLVGECRLSRFLGTLLSCQASAGAVLAQIAEGQPVLGL